MSLLSVSSLLMVRELSMLHFKEMLEISSIDSLLSYPKSTIREVSLQSVLLVFEFKKDTII